MITDQEFSYPRDGLDYFPYVNKTRFHIKDPHKVDNKYILSKVDNVTDMMLAANTIIGFPFFNCKQTFIVYLSAITRMKTTHFDNDLRENCQHTLSQLTGVFFKFDRNG